MARVLCVEIGKSVMKLCEMDYKIKNPKVYQFLEAETPEDAIMDGYLNPDCMETLQEALLNVINSNGIKTKRIIFSVVSGKIINREITIPPVKVNHIDDIVQTNLTEYFPVDLSEHETTSTLLETYKEGPDAGKHRVLVMAAEKRLVGQYKSLADKCGLVLTNLNYGGDCIFQAIKDNKEEETCAVIKVEENHSAISIIKAGQLKMQRSIPYGVGEVIEQIKDKNGYQVKSFLESWRLSSRQDFTTDQEIKQILEGIVGSVSRIIDYYNSHSSGDEVAKILLVGMGAEIMGLPQEVERLTGIGCQIMTKMGRVTLNTNIPDKRMGTFLGCVGAGLAPGGFVHDDKKEKEKNQINYARMSVLVGIFLLVLSGGLAALALFPYMEQVEEEKHLQNLITTYEPGKVLYERCESVKAFYNQMMYGSELTKHQNDSILAFLEELEQKLPADVVMMEFSSDDDTAVMKMRVDDKEVAAKVIETLRNFDSIMNVRVNTIEEIPEEADAGSELVVVPTKVEFQIDCQYYPRISQD